MKHNKTFHQLFPDIPMSEDLIHGRWTKLKERKKDLKYEPYKTKRVGSPLPAYVCALQKEVPFHGRLYITDTHACFYSSVLLKDTKVGLQLCPGTSLIMTLLCNNFKLIKNYFRIISPF